METSLIFVSYNSFNVLNECICSALKHRIPIESIIVVDNASDDNSVNKLKTNYKNLNIIALSENLGYGGAINVALSKVTSRYVSILNPDMIFTCNPFPKLEKYYATHQNIGVVGIQQLFPNKKWQASYGRFISISQIIEDLFFISRIKNIFDRICFNFGYKRIKKVEYVDGAFMFAETNRINNIGGFDEKTFFFYYEDADLAKRFIDSGYINICYTRLSIIHYRGYLSTKNRTLINTFSLEQYTNGIFEFLKKHYSKKYINIYVSLLHVQSLKQLFIVKVLSLIINSEKHTFKRERYKHIINNGIKRFKNLTTDEKP